MAGRTLNPDTAGLKGYVMAADGHEYDTLAEGDIRVTVTHCFLKTQFWELKFDKHMTIAAVKERIYRHTGTPAEYQDLLLKSGGVVVASLNEDARMLGFYSPTSGMEIHVIDKDPHSMARGGGLEDVSKIKKYEMTDEEYDKRENTIRAYARKQRAKDPSFKFFPKPRDSAPRPDRPDCESKECVEGIELGMRCEVAPGGRRGEVAYVGEVKGLSTGYFVGVRFDEPLGKHDGRYNGKQYFEAEPKYAGFVRPYNVKVGDYPPVDPFDIEDSDDEEGGATGGAGGAGTGDVEAKDDGKAGEAEAAKAPTEAEAGEGEAGSGEASAAEAAPAGAEATAAATGADAAAPAAAEAAAPAAEEDDDEL